jgi:hypothetical protein
MRRILKILPEFEELASGGDFIKTFFFFVDFIKLFFTLSSKNWPNFKSAFKGKALVALLQL